MNDRFENAGGPASNRLSYKFQRLREQLRQAIRQRELTGRLPGERELGRRFSANAKTINKALSDLSAEGLVVRHVGRGTFVVGSEEGAAQTESRRYWWVPQSGAATTPLFDLIQKQVVSDSPADRIESIEAAALGARSRSSNGHGLGSCNGVMLCGVEPEPSVLAMMLRRHVPMVLIGGGGECARIDTVQPDDADGGFQLTEHLIQSGYRRVHLVADAPQSDVVDRVLNGYRAACHRRQLTPTKPITPADVRRAPTEFADQALIVIGSAALASVMEALTPLSSREQPCVTAIPDVGDRPAERWQTASYDVDADRVAEWAVRLLRDWNPGQPPMQVIVPGRLSVRGAARRPSVIRDVPRPTTDAIL